MFFLFGEKNNVQQVVTGQFQCPLCQATTDYSQHLNQPSYTFFGIPIAKLNVSSDYLVCHVCGSCYAPQIIEHPEDHQLAVDKAILIRTLCYLLSGYGDTVQARTRLIELYKRYALIEITNQNIDTELSVIQSGQHPTLPFIKQHTLRLSPKAKQDIIIACYQFANGSSLMEHQDRVRVNTIASSMDVSLPEVEYLINHSA